MATKVTIIGDNEMKTPLKKIVFNKFLDNDDKVEIIGCSNPNPDQYNNIELICKDYNQTGEDIMYVYDHNRNEGVLYLGYFNDGVV